MRCTRDGKGLGGGVQMGRDGRNGGGVGGIEDPPGKPMQTYEPGHTI